jgi:phage virion morphogenesis protein
MSQFSVTVEDQGVRAALSRMLRLMGDSESTTQKIADIGEASTRLRFRTQTGPDGEKWKRGWKTGGRILVQSGHLRDSLSTRATPDTAEWGVNRIYAAIHQFGGTIRAKKAKALKFPIPGGGFAVKKAVTMPARPYLGISDDDRNDILSMLEERFNGAIHATGN